jgi:very-short-patch-repair endonuclease
LVGVKNGNLSYDFYLPNHNLLIEYQGVQHEKPIDFEGKGKKYAKQIFKKQQEHDKRKREYAIINSINLLEIWYWDFDNIEEILTEILLYN